MSSKHQITKEFKINAVKYALEHSDLTKEQICKNLGISPSSLYRWINDYQKEIDETGTDENIFRGSGNYSSEEKKELARLRKENRDLKDAIEVLKKAMNIINSR